MARPSFPGVVLTRRGDINVTVQHAVWQSAILEDVGHPVFPGMRILDLGCGNGTGVRQWMSIGHDAYGCDLQFKAGPEVEPLVKEGRLQLIEPSPYRLPYPDGHFDVLITNQVLEHVHDYPSTVAEMRRVLKPEGVCLHFFPSRWIPVEPHVRVPFASIFRNRVWLTLWARLGVRKAGQRNLPWRDVVRRNHEYLESQTNYLRGKQIKAEFIPHFREVRYVERAFLHNTPNTRGKILFKLGSVFPCVFLLFRNFWSRILLARP